MSSRKSNPSEILVKDALLIPQTLGPVLDFLRTIWAMDHALQKFSKRMEMRIGVTAPQRLVIRILGRYPGMQARQLAAILHLHPSTLTGVLRRLQRRGLITRRADPQDHRCAILGLTPKGYKLNIDAEETVESAVHTVLKTTPQAIVEETTAMFQKLTVALEADRSFH